MASRLEVAEAMYQAGKAGTRKMPDSLDEPNVPTQNRYLLLAEAAIAAAGDGGSAAPDDLTVDLADHLAFKLNHPHQVLDGADDALQRFAAHVGEDYVSDEVKAVISL